MSDEKYFFRTIAIENALELCFRFLNDAVKIREFTSGNTKLSAQDYGYEDKSMITRFSKPHFSLSVSELYDLIFLAFYEQEMEKRQGRSGELRIVTDIEDIAAKDHVKSEMFFCDGALAFGAEGDEGYMPVQHVKVISFELQDKDRTVEDEAIRLIDKKKSKRAQYPPMCALVVSIIADHSGIDYPRILNGIRDINFEKLYFIEHHDTMRSATVISVDPTTLKADRNSLTITPTIKNPAN